MASEKILTGNHAEDEEFIEGGGSPVYGMKGLVEESTLGSRGTDPVVSEPVVSEPKPSLINRAANAVVRHTNEEAAFSQSYRANLEERLANAWRSGQEVRKPSREVMFGNDMADLRNEAVGKVAKVVAKNTQGGLKGSK
jgi:hypothetical protein